jgi:hypothetical protein
MPETAFSRLDWSATDQDSGAFIHLAEKFTYASF